MSALSAAPAIANDVVLAGALDGHLRAFRVSDGKLLFDYDTAHEFSAVNHVPAKGGAIDGPGPIVVNDMVLVNSGYGRFGEMAGNVLLAFALRPR